MKIVLWVVQGLLALHTITGALWKFSNSEQSVPSLSALPHGMWLGLSGFELLCSAALLLPALSQRFGSLAVLGAAGIAAEMLLFTGLHLASGSGEHGQVIYWLVVAAVCGFVAYGRRALVSSTTRPRQTRLAA